MSNKNSTNLFYVHLDFDNGAYSSKTHVTTDAKTVFTYYKHIKYNMEILKWMPFVTKDRYLYNFIKYVYDILYGTSYHLSCIKLASIFYDFVFFLYIVNNSYKYDDHFLSIFHRKPSLLRV